MFGLWRGGGGGGGGEGGKGEDTHDRIFVAVMVRHGHMTMRGEWVGGLPGERFFEEDAFLKVRKKSVKTLQNQRSRCGSDGQDQT